MTLMYNIMSNYYYLFVLYLFLCDRHSGTCVLSIVSFDIIYCWLLSTFALILPLTEMHSPDINQTVYLQNVVLWDVFGLHKL